MKKILIITLISFISLNILGQQYELRYKGKLSSTDLGGYARDMSFYNDTCYILTGSGEILVTKAKLQSQCGMPYKPFIEFQRDSTLVNDTLSYLNYNFDKRWRCYKGKTINDVIEDLELPVKAFTWSTDGVHINLSLCFSDYSYTQEEAFSPSRYQGITINIEDTIQIKTFNKLRKKFPNTRWMSEHYEFFKNLKVKSIWKNYSRESFIEKEMKQRKETDDILHGIELYLLKKSEDQ